MPQADIGCTDRLLVGHLGPLPLNAPVPVAPKSRSEAEDGETEALSHAEMGWSSGHMRFCHTLWLRSHHPSPDGDLLVAPRMTPRSLVVVRSQSRPRRPARSHCMDLIDLLSCLLAPRRPLRSVAYPKCTPRVGLQWCPHVNGVEAVTLLLMALLDRCDLGEPAAVSAVPPMQVHRLQDFRQEYQQLTRPRLTAQEL